MSSISTKKSGMSPGRLFLRRFRRQKVALVALGVITAILVIAIIAPSIVPYDPDRPVTAQYEEKGIDVNQLFGDRVSCYLVLSDGSQLPLSNVTVESGNRRVAAARSEDGSAVITAVNAGTTYVKVEAGQVTSLVHVDVSQTGDPIPSVLMPVPLTRLNVGETTMATVKAIISNGKTVTDPARIQGLIDRLQQLKTTQDMTGGWGDPDPVSYEPRYESLTPEIVSVDESGRIAALKAGQGLVRVEWGELATVIPVGVEVEAVDPVAVAVSFSKPKLSLVDIYKHQKPSARHWFGTDHQNRDIFSRVLVGTRQTLMIGFVSVGLGATIGTVLGLLAGYYGGWLDSLLSRAMDVLLAFPGNLLAIAIIAALGPGIYNIIFSVAVYSVPIFLRIVRASTLSLKNATYVEAARSVGVPDWVIIFRHVFPGTISVVLVYLTMRIGTAILIGASLSFLGLGGDVTAPEWGAMLNAAKDNSRNVLHPNFFPGLAIMLTVLSFNLFGDGLRDALDPKLRD